MRFGDKAGIGSEIHIDGLHAVKTHHQIKWFCLNGLLHGADQAGMPGMVTPAAAGT